MRRALGEHLVGRQRVDDVAVEHRLLAARHAGRRRARVPGPRVGTTVVPGRPGRTASGAGAVGRRAPSRRRRPPGRRSRRARRPRRASYCRRGGRGVARPRQRLASTSLAAARRRPRRRAAPSGSAHGAVWPRVDDGRARRRRGSRSVGARRPVAAGEPVGSPAASRGTIMCTGVAVTTSSAEEPEQDQQRDGDPRGEPARQRRRDEVADDAARLAQRRRSRRPAGQPGRDVHERRRRRRSDRARARCPSGRWPGPGRGGA